MFFFFFFQAEDGIRDKLVTGVQTCALPIWPGGVDRRLSRRRLLRWLDTRAGLAVDGHVWSRRGHRRRVARVDMCTRRDRARRSLSRRGERRTMRPVRPWARRALGWA